MLLATEVYIPVVSTSPLLAPVRWTTVLPLSKLISFSVITGATSPLFAERSSILVISTVGFVWSTVKLSVAYGSDTLLARSVALMVNV